MVSRRVAALLCAPVAVAGFMTGAASTADAGLPPGTTPVTVSAGVVTANIDAQVTPLGAIAGKVTSAASGKAIAADVYVFSASGTLAGRSFSGGAEGRYRVDFLPPAQGYRVCVSGVGASGGGSTTGYLSRCWRSAAWDGLSRTPIAAKPVTVSAGSVTPGIDLALPSAAAISGVINNRAGSTLGGAVLRAQNLSTGQVFQRAGGFGSYKLQNLTRSARGYKVCVHYSLPRVGLLRPTGYFGTCRAGVVSVRLGVTHTGINLSLGPGGGISGKVTETANGNGVGGLRVDVFNAAGRFLGSDQTTNTGRYLIGNLRPSTGDVVCVRPLARRNNNRTHRNEQVSFPGLCYKNVPWSGGQLPARRLTGVRVTAGGVHTGIDFALTTTVTPYGWIAGTIRSGVDGTTPIADEPVLVYTATGARVASIFNIDSLGRYRVRVLPSTAGYIVCARTPDPAPTTPIGGFAPHCYPDVSWDGADDPPTDATTVPVAAGQTTSGIDISLPVGGAISGNVTLSGTTDPARADVKVFRASDGRFVSAGFAFGSYSIDGLLPGVPYTVCFRVFGVSPGAPYGSASQCYNDVSWTPGST